MAEKKIIKKSTPKTSGKEEKISMEEIKKRREEVLARIDAEIGEEVLDEPVIDEKDDDTAVIEKESESVAESFEKEMLEEEKQEEDSKHEDEALEEDEAVDDKEKEPFQKKEDIEVVELEEIEDKRETGSPFSAAEFGLSEKKSNKGKNAILFIVVFLLVAIISALFYFFATGTLKFEPKEEEVVTSPTETPTPSPTPVEFDRADITVEVLNGSGVGGAAGAMESFLEELGYENIEVGNADNSDYENITIQVKKEFEDIASLIVEDLETDYVVNSDYETLDGDSEYEVVIIVGVEASEDDTQVEEEPNE